MKLVLVEIVLLSAFHSVHPQQCRQVTVCDESSPPNHGSGLKGEKGDVGAPGKAGPAGKKGNKGEIGEKGESSGVDELQDEVRRKFSEISILLTPASCRTSSVYGKQTLRSGDEAFCDGGWTVFQKRFNGSVSFDRNWNEFKIGFGSLSGEFWLGLDKIHRFTRGRGCRLRVDMWSFDYDHAYAEYSDFSVEDESDNYRWHISGYSGTAGDSLTGSYSLDNMQFSTKDRDNDARKGNCGLGSGWWHRGCTHATLNQAWGVSTGRWTKILWYDWKGAEEALRETALKMRCD